jgi:hypothetical protein
VSLGDEALHAGVFVRHESRQSALPVVQYRL